MDESYQEWPLGSSLARCAWAVKADRAGEWLQPATEFWGLGFGATRSGISAEVVGPAAQPQRFEVSPGDRFWGVEFEAHVFWPGLEKAKVDGLQALEIHGQEFVLGDARFPLPAHDRLSGLVDALPEAGVLVADRGVARALGVGGRPGVAERTLRRRVRAVVGMNRQQVASVRRARAAYRLLSQGVPIGQVVERLGYSDQSHLSRSLRSLAGRTPREVLLAGR